MKNVLTVSSDIARMAADKDKTSCANRSYTMLKLAKVTTAKMIVWARNGKAMLAKCAKSGKFVKLADAQFLLDNIAYCAAKAMYSSTLVDRTIGSKLFEQLKAQVGKISFEHGLGQTFTNGSPLLACRLLCSNK